MKEERYTDIVILGGGMAGMTAGIYAARANRSCAILESGITGGLANSTYVVNNFPSYLAVHGMDLMRKVREQVDRLGVAVEEICEMIAFDLWANPKRIETEEAVYIAGAVIIATGRNSIPLDVPTECAQVHYCAICDGAPYAGKRVLVAGGGNSAFDESLYLLQLGIADLTVVESMDRFFAAQSTQDDLLSRPNVKAYTRTRVADLALADGVLREAILEHLDTGLKTSLPVDGIFVFLGQKPNSELFRGLLPQDDAGYIIANSDMETGIPGVFSAGDINVKSFRQLTTAAADGTIAALMADRYLRGNLSKTPARTT